MSDAGRLLWVDASQGASGDMILGALVDLGVPLERIRRAIESLPLEGWSLRSRRIVRCGLAAEKVDVEVGRSEPGHGWEAIRKIVEGGDLTEVVRERALVVFRRLIEVEARVHDRPFEEVHLHEAGATDAIVDVVGAAVGLEHLSVERVVVSPMTTGFGSVRCGHGLYPVPAPATAELVRGVPVRGGEIEAERLTPTGAAILTTIAQEWGALPLLRPIAIGHGAGSRELGEVPNMLRMILGEREASVPRLAGSEDEVAVLECTLDDATPQAVAYASQRLLDAGALDVFTTAVTMKKGRVGHQLTVLGPPARGRELGLLLLEETSTLGLRHRTEKRWVLERSVCSVRTGFGPVDVKVGRLDGRLLQAWPEYEQCARLAGRHGVSLQEVQQAALEAYRAAPGRDENESD